MKTKIIFLLLLTLSVSIFTGCTFLQDVKEVAEGYLNNSTTYYPFVEFGEQIDTQTGALSSQSVNNEFVKSTLTDIYARMAILTTNKTTFSFIYKIKLGRDEIDSGTITGTLTPGISTNYVAIVVPVRSFGYGTYTVDFYDSSDTLRAVASGSFSIAQAR